MYWHPLGPVAFRLSGVARNRYELQTKIKWSALSNAPSSAMLLNSELFAYVVHFHRAALPVCRAVNTSRSTGYRAAQERGGRAKGARKDVFEIRREIRTVAQLTKLASQAKQRGRPLSNALGSVGGATFAAIRPVRAPSVALPSDVDALSRLAGALCPVARPSA